MLKLCTSFDDMHMYILAYFASRDIRMQSVPERTRPDDSILIFYASVMSCAANTTNTMCNRFTRTHVSLAPPATKIAS